MAFKAQIITNEEQRLKIAYAACLRIAKQHYENFPVASFFLPTKQRLAIAAIYAFARTADDFADSATLSEDGKIAALKAFQDQLDNDYVDPNQPYADIFLALFDAIKTYKLSKKLLNDLLLAFIQDVTKHRYYDFAEVLDYCKLSANPIGQLLLQIFGVATAENIIYADFICTSLQLINFMQDIYLDVTKLNRCYLPLVDLNQQDLSVNDIKDRLISANFDKLVQEQLQRISVLYRQGVPLIGQVPGMFGFYLKLIIASGARILSKLYLRADHFNRVTLSVADVWPIVKQGLLSKYKFIIAINKTININNSVIEKQ